MDTHLLLRRFFKAIILLEFVTGVSGFPDFTCFSLKPRIAINGDNGMFIAGYKSGSDIGATVTFGRVLNTGTSNGLPTGSSQRDHTRVSARLLDMPPTGGVQRIGAFYCNANKNGVMEQITTVIMSTSSVVRPREISQTVSIGEPVNFVVDKNADVPTLRWRHNDNYMEELDNQNTYTIQSVTSADAGVYECYDGGRRAQGTHAIFLLIVRACSSGKWGTSCRQFCPVCRNGGICDDRSGSCVCAPGFSGTSCQTVHGRNKWGQDGQLQCSGLDDHTYGCQGKLFCLPHPYGCSCAAGFKGLDCNQECSYGTYGAGCRSTCHCKSGGSVCARDTGECTGQCEDGWSGPNCQEQCPASPGKVTGVMAFTDGNSITVSWSPGEYACVRKEYIVEYVLASRGQCGSPSNPGLIEAGQITLPYLTIQNLEYYSTYIVYVSAILDGVRSDRSLGTSPLSTAKGAPNFKPTVNSFAILKSNGLFFSWDEAPCHMIRGEELQYKYQLLKGIDVVMSVNVTSTNVEFNGLVECESYSFQVRASNNVGDGPWSDLTHIETRTIVPGPVNAFRVTSVPTGNELHLTWQPTTGNNCLETSYDIQYTLLNWDQCNITLESPRNWFTYARISDNSLYTTINELPPYSTYNVSVSALNSAGKGQLSYIIQSTNISTPSAPPSDIKASEVTSNAITFRWSKPKCGYRHGDIIAYSYRLLNSSGEFVAQNTTVSTVQFIEGLQPFTNYSFEIAAMTEKGAGPYSKAIIQSTAEAVPSKPLNFGAVDVTRRTISISWQKPRYPNGDITKFSIQKRIISKPYDITFKPSSQSDTEDSVDDVTQMTYTLDELKPSTQYEVNISAYSSVGKGDVASLHLFTLPATSKDIPTPKNLLNADNVGEITSTTVAIVIPLSASEYLTHYLISVVPKDVRRKRQTSVDLHVVAELPKNNVTMDQTFLIGDNETYGLHYNPPLNENATYILYIGFASRINKSTVGVSWSEGLDFTVIPTISSMDVSKDMAPTSFFPAFVVVSVLLFILFTISLTMAFKIRSMKIQLKECKGNIFVPEAAGKKPQVASGQVIMSSDGYVEYKVSQQEDSTYQDLGDDRSEKQQGSKAESFANKVESGQVVMSSDGYVEYKVTQQEDSTYQDLGDDRSEKQRGNEAEYAYVNESMIKESKAENDDYEDVGNK